MFEDRANPRVYGLPPGADFPKALVDGLTRLTADLPPEDVARITIYMNTRRMQRRTEMLFADDPPRLLPRLKIITDIARDIPLPDVPFPVSPLRRQLELTRLVESLLDADTTLAPRAAAADLASSLAALMDEMQGEGVPMSAISSLEVADISGHWARSQSFLSIVDNYLADQAADRTDPEARQRMAVERLLADWAASPPTDPVIIAGSTGSRGTTAMLMQAISRLPQGAVVLPGFDPDLPSEIWSRLTTEAAEDHPQFRFARLLAQLGMDPEDVHNWPSADAPRPAANRLVSLALRPAPVTNQWLKDGPTLGDMREATRGLTLIEAPTPRAEAQSIACILRQAAEEGRPAALVTPDRMLTRRVSALLDRWNIEPDDSAGRPLVQSPPGRLLRHVIDLMQGSAPLEAILSMLKHPLAHVGADRGRHLRLTHEFELWLRRKGEPWPSPETFLEWGRLDSDERAVWASWAASLLRDAFVDRPWALAGIVAQHAALAERLVSGSVSDDDSELWNKPAGRKALEVVTALRLDAPHAGDMSVRDYRTLFGTLLEREEVRDPEAPHPGVMIWGTLEARVQGAELVILGGLNEGTWPEMPAPDPWLNRRMRRDAGLLLPERRIGLSAHDFQQAIAAAEVVLSRATRDESSEPVPSRWLNRLTNLLDGLTQTGGPEAMKAMRHRGQGWISRAVRLESPEAGDAVAPEPRPSPRPPLAMRPRRLSVTSIEKLIRDPYSIYARHILKLKPLDPLRPDPGALEKGRVVHTVFERFMRDWSDELPVDHRAHLLDIARAVVTEEVHWPVARQLWYAQIEALADWFIGQERFHAQKKTFLASESGGELVLDAQDFTLHGRADRIDRAPGSGLVILDYKTGSVPSAKTMQYFDVQLLLEALIAEAGGFEDLPAETVSKVGYIGLGASPKYDLHDLVDKGERRFATQSVQADLIRLLSAYDQPGRGYTARRAMHKVRFEGDYDHLARFGEWSDSDPSHGIDLK